MLDPVTEINATRGFFAQGSQVTLNGGRHIKRKVRILARVFMYCLTGAQLIRVNRTFDTIVFQ